MDTQEIRTVIMVTPLLINFILLFNRKKKWVKNKYKWYILILLSFTGIFLFYYNGSYKNEILIQWAFFTPLVFSIIDFTFMKLSFLIHNRDLHLWLKGSNDIDDTKLSGGKHVRASDRFFSLILLFSIIILPFIILFFIDKTK